ncbi:MAG: DnaJ domain-containing protein [bacterium]|jgi:hypothetical protein|nr:DnaJ domain-containing protein [bacterium]
MTNFSHYHYYEILEIDPGASRDEIRTAYRDLCKVWHPDRFEGDERLQKKAEEKLKEINEAYQILNQASTRQTEPPPYQERTRPEPPPRAEKPRSEQDTGPFSQSRRTYAGSARTEPWEGTGKDSIPPLSLIQKFFIGAAVLLILFGVLIEMNWLPTNASQVSSSEPSPGFGGLTVTDAIPALQTTNPQETSTLHSGEENASPAANPSVLDQHITLGTPADRVKAIQGQPDKITDNPLLEFEVWNYGASTITIETANQKVIEWNNRDQNLLIKLIPNTPTDTQFLAIGSSQDDVIRLQGTPDKIVRSPSLGFSMWYFGASKIKLSLENHVVMELTNQGGNLKTN